jgi:PAS domain S-box-containing protein
LSRLLFYVVKVKRVSEGSIRILVVDDDPEVSSTFRKFLETRFEASVEVAERVSDAKHTLENNLFDVVVLDYKLPDGDGLELLKEITSQRDHPAVVFVTGEGGEQVASESMKRHASGYVMKDERLLEALPEAVGSAVSEVSLRRAQEALLRSEETERALLNATSESLMLLDSEGDILAINETAAKRMGAGVDDLVGGSVFDRLPEVLVRERRKHLAEVFDRGEPAHFDDTVDGVDLETVVYPVFDSRRRVYRVAVFSQDVTERKRAEAELVRARDELERRVEERTEDLLRANEVLQDEIAERRRVQLSLQMLTERIEQQAMMLDDILSSSPDQFLLYDRKGKHIYANKPAAASMGFEQVDIEGKYWWELNLPEDIMGPFDVEREGAIESGETRTGEFTFPTTGGPRSYQYILTPLKRPDGTSDSVLATIRDISDLKEVQLELQAHSRKLEEQAELLDLAHDTIMVRDMGSVILFWNKGAEEMYGWSKEEALGRNSHELLHTEFPEPLEDIEFDLLREGRWEGELIHRTRDGRTVVVESRQALKYGDGPQPAGVLELNYDITEHRLAEEELAMHTAAVESQAELLDLLPEAVIARDMNGLVLSWSGAAENMFGWEPEEALGRSVDTLLKTEFPMPLEDIEDVLLREGEWKGVLTQTTKSGERIEVSSRWALRYSADGAPDIILQLDGTP